MRKKKTGPRPRPKKYKPPPFGYKYVDGEYIQDESTYRIVEDIFYLFNDRRTLTDIKWDMENNDWPRPRGGKWTAWTIRKILSNRFYVDSENPIVTKEIFNRAAARLGKIKPGPQ